MDETATIAAASAPRSGYPAGAPDAPAVSVVLAPQQSVVSLVVQAASRQSHGAPTSLLAAVRSALRPRARFAAQSFTVRGWIPDACTPIPPLADASVADQAARLRDLPTAQVSSDASASKALTPAGSATRSASPAPVHRVGRTTRGDELVDLLSG